MQFLDLEAAVDSDDVDDSEDDGEMGTSSLQQDSESYSFYLFQMTSLLPMTTSLQVPVINFT
jgi:hypothetical protein